MTEKYAIELKGVSKYFGSVIANKNINLSLKKGEILSLLGENGSGKTTLMNMISGIYYPDEGNIFINGKEAVIRSPKDAFKYKIGMIHQHFKLVDTFTVAENIILGVDKSSFDYDSAVKGLNKKLRDNNLSAIDLGSKLDGSVEYYDCKDLNKLLQNFKKEMNFEISLFENTKTKQEVFELLTLNYKNIGLVVENLNDYLTAESYSRQDVEKIVKTVYKKIKFKKFLDRFNNKEIVSRVEKISKRYGFNIDPKEKIYNLSVSEKQTVEILKVLYRGADILILDEPTAVLTPQEIKKLFDVLRTMKKYGKSVIIITHKLNEVMEISDRVSILRKGEYIGTVNTSESSEKELTEMMVGKKIDLKIERIKTDFDKPLLEIRDLNINKDDGSKAIDNVSFYIRGGEILGVAGIAGCGQKELCEAIAGLRNIESGLIMHKGESIIGLPAREIIEKGVSMSFIPEDRLGMGLCPSFSITDNMMLKTYQENYELTEEDKTDIAEENKFKKFIKVAVKKTGIFFKKAKGFLFVDRKSAREQAQKLIDKLEIVTPSTETPVRRLSGGNVQKVLVGREIESGPNVIITAYPVRGLDINSSYVIYDILNEEKKKGTGILFIGEDLDVMLALCDKIMVICHGKNMGVVHADKTTKEEIGLMMTGSLDLTEVKKDKEYGKAKDSNLSEKEWKEEKIKAEEMEEKKND